MTLADLWQNPRGATISPSPQGTHVNSRTAAQRAENERSRSAFDDLIEVCRRSNRSEYDVQSRVESLIAALVPDADLRGNVGELTGEIDLLVNNNVIVEAKVEADDLGIAPMWARQDQDSRRRFAASQLQDYVNARYEGVESSHSRFVGYTTNGIVWQKYAVAVGAELPEKVGAWSPEKDHDANALFDELARDITTRPRPPEDLSELLAKFPLDAVALARSLAGSPEFETKRRVWEDLMRGASVQIPASEEERVRLFASHSVLVEFARGVSQVVLGNKTVRQDPQAQSFSDWIATIEPRSGSTGRDPDSLRNRIDAEVQRYDWTLSGVDDLKSVYHDFIPASVRHDFGEYYTPDWLADAVCEKVLDDQWCRRALARAMDAADDLRGCGFLEPSCGSGTFLRAAVKRLIPFAEELTSNPTQQSDAICRLVHGLDLHPVAVELARSTLLASLPAPPTNGIAAANVWLADTLRWVEETDMRLFAQEGFLINVPGVANYPSKDIILPTEVVDNDGFTSIVDDLFDFLDDLRFLEHRLPQYGLSEPSISTLVDLAVEMRGLTAQGRNDVWRWYLLNFARARILHNRKFDRIAGNPPWITMKDLDAARQEKLRTEAMRLGIWAGAQLATQNNLAALFAATVARDYTAADQSWNVGFVLPWSALGTDVWAPFRAGSGNAKQGVEGAMSIDLSEKPWDFKGMSHRPFPQSDACVVFGRSPAPAPGAVPSERVAWRGTGIVNPMSLDEVKQRVVQQSIAGPTTEESAYLGRVKNGATLFPIGLVKVDLSQKMPLGPSTVRITTISSTRRQWKGILIKDAVIERDCLHRTVCPENIAPFRLVDLSAVAIPPRRAFLNTDPMAIIAGYQHFGKHWFRASDTYQERRTSSSPPTLLERVNRWNCLVAQWSNETKFRLVYPKSGEHLFGVVTTRRILIDNACYYINVETAAEALYLCSLLGADCLQDQYRESQTTDHKHFDTYPWRNVPLPDFDPGDPMHARLAMLGRRAMAAARSINVSGETTKRRAIIRDGLREHGIMGEIDDVVRQLLPSHSA